MPQHRETSDRKRTLCDALSRVSQVTVLNAMSFSLRLVRLLTAHPQKQPHPIQNRAEVLAALTLSFRPHFSESLVHASLPNQMTNQDPADQAYFHHAICEVRKVTARLSMQTHIAAQPP